MHRSLLPLLCCPGCHGELQLAAPVTESEIQDGVLRCSACGRAYGIEGGIPILAPREDLDAYADRWPDGLADESLVRKIAHGREQYASGGPFAAWVDAAAQTRGVILDIATGPGSSLLGALAPLMPEDTHLVATDASLYLLPRLKGAWAAQSIKPSLDFVAMDGNRWPCRADVLNGVTSAFGFGCVWDDPKRQEPPRFGHAYREAARTLKPGGRVFESCLLYASDSETAAVLEGGGCINASRPRLELFWQSLGLEIEWAEELRRGEGKLDEGDLVPYGEHDVWWEICTCYARPRDWITGLRPTCSSRLRCPRPGPSARLCSSHSTGVWYSFSSDSPSGSSPASIASMRSGASSVRRRRRATWELSTPIRAARASMEA